MAENLELREWIAVNVMGWEYHARSTLTTPLLFHKDQPGNIKTLDRADSVPHYESDIAAAWLVVEAMRAREWIFSMKSYMRNSVYPWGASFAQPFSGVVQMEPGNFAPLAICLAAKAAIEATQ